MKAIVLAAGYGTRLGSLTRNVPKPLLPVQGRPLLEYILEWILKPGVIQDVTIVSNDRYYESFKLWYQSTKHQAHISLLNDRTKTNETRLGAIRDLALALGLQEDLEDTLVIGGDNLYPFAFQEMLSFYEEQQASVIGAYRLADTDKLTRTGVVEVDEQHRVIGFEEKPTVPRSPYASPALYILTAEALSRVSDYLDQGFESDAPGHFISWLYRKEPLYAFPYSGPRIAVDDPETYQAVEALILEKRHL